MPSASSSPPCGINSVKATTAIVGSGNLAWHLSAVLPGDVSVVVRRALPDADTWTVPLIRLGNLPALRPQAVFLAVPDNEITNASLQLAEYLPPHTLVFHTSGATPVTRIAEHFDHRGVLWPIRSLRKGETVNDWQDLPLVIYGTDSVAADYLATLAHRLSRTVARLDDTQRAQLHLAAVFSNNFVSALYEVAYRLCRQQGIPFELLLPIIRNTAGREDGTSPASRQTGAAARGDTATMDRHLATLQPPTYQALYRALSDLILQHGLPQHNLDLGSDPYDDL